MAAKKKPAPPQAEARTNGATAIDNASPDERTVTPQVPSAELPDDGTGSDPQTQPSEPEKPSTDNAFRIVGIGASAGGLAALTSLFSKIPENSGLAYVVVVHLSPEHKSHLAELLQPHIKIPVEQVMKTVPIEPNRVYIIPPNANLDTIDTHLRLTELEERRYERAPIDHFFRTLSKMHGENAIGVVLTGTGSDGALGLREIKENGGLVIVQDPNEAEYDGMPQSAISTGAVDLVLPLEKIPDAIINYARTRPDLPESVDTEDVEEEARRVLQKIFAHIRARTGRDFSRYKTTTIFRRIQRRMQIHQVEELPQYLALLREQPDEVRMLADDLLINVTSFFRDADVFAKLETEVIPGLFQRKGIDGEIRLWSIGCATGEEAYSLAMLLLEEAAHHDHPPRLQVFASDLHERSLGRARDGLYLGDIQSDVSPERIKRWFVKENGGYRICKAVRELVVFAPHNLLADPPFSRLDMISCRNLLIYLQRGVQQDITELFHYALRPNGVLLLGSSETIESGDLFLLEDKKTCLYRKHDVPTAEPRLPPFPMARTHVGSDTARLQYAGEPTTYGALHQRMVERYAPPSMLLNPDDKVVHLSEHAGRYLVHPGGELTSNAYRLVREELRIELRAAIQAAREDKHPVHSKPISFNYNGETTAVVLWVRATPEPQEDFVLVVFDEHDVAEAKVVPADNRPEPPTGQPPKSPRPKGDLTRERELETELHFSRQRLQAIIEEYETTQEETKASNEELQSTNEELRSTMEELETSKEELQSMNEELQTVNQENRHKVEELSLLSSDLQNLMTATNIATLFLDRDLRVLRFTPRVTELFNLRVSDRGRPLSDITHKLGYNELAEDAAQVLTKLVPIRREVQDAEGDWYLTHVLPYRSVEDRIEGVVITFVDISDLRHAERSQQELLSRLNSLIAHAPWGIVLFDIELRVMNLNGPIVGDDPNAGNKIIGKRLSDVVPMLGAKVEPLLKQVRETGESILSTEISGESVSDPKNIRHWLASFYPVHDADGKIEGIGAVALEITDRKNAEEQLRISEHRLGAELAGMAKLHDFVTRLLVCHDMTAALDEVLTAAIDITDADMGMVQLVDPQTTELKIVTQRGFSQEFLDEFGSKATDLESPCSRCFLQGERVVVSDVFHDVDFASNRAMAEAAGYRAQQCTPLLSRAGASLGVLSTFYQEPGPPTERDLRMLDLYARQSADFTEHVRNRDALNDADRRKDEFLATLAHELRNPLAPISSGLHLLRLSPDKNQAFAQIGDTLDRQLRQLVTLVDDLLDVSRISRGKMQLKTKTIDIASIIESAVETSKPLIDESEHELTIDVPSEPIRIKADPNRMAQVVSNLLNNAAKYTPSKGKIQLIVKREGSIVLVTVKDNGIGIAEDQMDRIFEMFGQVDNSREMGGGGLGIGLTLVKSLVEMHGGIVEIHSDGPNKGSEFTIRLPILNEKSTDGSSLDESGDEQLLNIRRRVLVVDDNQAAVDMLSRVVKLLGHEVETARDGLQAIAVAKRFRPDIVLMDLGMPKLNGYDAARRIRQEEWGKNMILVALTGWGQIKDRGRTEEAGFDHHLVKPARPADLRKLIAIAEQHAKS